MIVKRNKIRVAALTYCRKPKTPQSPKEKSWNEMVVKYCLNAHTNMYFLKQQDIHDTAWDRGFSEAYDMLEEELAKILEATEHENGGGRAGVPLEIIEIAKRRMATIRSLEKALDRAIERHPNIEG